MKDLPLVKGAMFQKGAMFHLNGAFSFSISLLIPISMTNQVMKSPSSCLERKVLMEPVWLLGTKGQTNYTNFPSFPGPFLQIFELPLGVHGCYMLHKIVESNKAKACVYFYFLGMLCMCHKGEVIFFTRAKTTVLCHLHPSGLFRVSAEIILLNLSCSLESPGKL